jgi:hypothetical protein
MPAKMIATKKARPSERRPRTGDRGVGPPLFAEKRRHRLMVLFPQFWLLDYCKKSGASERPPARRRNRAHRVALSGSRGIGEYEMTSMKTLGFAIAIAFAASSFALAQQGNPTNNPPAAQQGNPSNNPAASSTQPTNPTNQPAASRTIHRTGTAANRQRVNQNRRVAARRRANRRLFAFQPSSRCRFVRVGNNLFRRICR